MRAIMAFIDAIPSIVAVSGPIGVTYSCVCSLWIVVQKGIPKPPI